MIQLERLAGITPSVFFYCSGDGCRFALSPAVLIAPYCRPSFFLVWATLEKGVVFFLFSAESDQRDGDFWFIGD